MLSMTYKEGEATVKLRDFVRVIRKSWVPIAPLALRGSSRAPSRAS
jgi:hypothetical protein